MAYLGLNVSNLTSSNGTRINIEEEYVIITTFSSVFSIVGGLIIFYSYYFVSDLRKYDSRILLLFLTAADVLTAVGNLLGTIRYYTIMRRGRDIDSRVEANCGYNDDLCVIQSFITTFSSLASFFWTLVIAFHLLSIVKWQTRRSLRGFILYHGLCWGIPVIITVSAAAYKVLGDNYLEGTGPWCWIKACLDHKTRIIWMLMTGKFWEVCSYLISAALFILLKIYIRRGQRITGHVPVGLREGDERFTLVWLFLYVLRIWGTVRFLLAWITDNNSFGVDDLNKVDKILLYFQCFGDSAQAGLNCILFCLLDKTIWKELRSLCHRNNETQSLLVEVG